MIEASCHCGAIRFSVATAPDEVNSCNCSICRRYGTLWAYYDRAEVRFDAGNGPTDTYIWGDRMLTFHRCRTCGCVAYWLPVDPAASRLGVNARLMAPDVLAAARVMYGDGASM